MAEEKLTLLRLPLAIFRFILDLLDRGDLHAFRLVSRACRYLSEPTMFRTVTLHDEARFAEDINESICDRLRSSKDEFSHYVRHLRIGPFRQEKNCPSTQVLVQVLKSFENLQEFSWSVRFSIPRGVLTAFHAEWPDARLHVNNNDREHQYTPLNTTILSSPQLHSATLIIFAERSLRGNFSEYPTLKSALVQAKKLKKLRLKVGFANSRGWPTGPFNLQFVEGDKFPALQELALPYKEYSLTTDHCVQWLAAMDWSKLRRLDLGHGAPGHLFYALTGRVPQLQALHFGFWSYSSSDTMWDCRDLYIIKRFLESIDGLEEIVVTNWTDTQIVQIWHGMLKKHGTTLRRLYTSYCAAEAKGWDLTEIQTLTEQCPGLQDLSVRVLIDRGLIERDNGPRYHSTLWPHHSLEELRKLKHLRNLNIELQLQESSHEFVIEGSRGEMFIIEEAARKRAIELFNQWLEYNHSSPIEVLRVKFTVLHPQKELEYVLKRELGLKREVKVERKFWGYELDITPAGTTFDPFG